MLLKVLGFFLGFVEVVLGNLLFLLLLNLLPLLDHKDGLLVGLQNLVVDLLL